MPYETRIPVESDTRDRLRARKRGNQTYNELLEEMIDESDLSGNQHGHQR